MTKKDTQSITKKDVSEIVDASTEILAHMIMGVNVDLSKKIEDSIRISEKGLIERIENSKEDLARMMASGFDNLSKSINALELRVDHLNSEFSQKIQGFDNRLEELATNRVRYDTHALLVKRVDVLEAKKN